jgi:hypothetical protein
MQSNAASLSNASDVRLEEARRTSLSKRRMTAKVILLSALFYYLFLFIWMFARRTSVGVMTIAWRTSVNQGQIES